MMATKKTTRGVATVMGEKAKAAGIVEEDPRVEERELEVPSTETRELEQAVSTAQQSLLYAKTPSEHIKTRRGQGGRELLYVTGHYVTRQLNLVFGWRWDFRVLESELITDSAGKPFEVRVLGELTVHSQHGWKSLTKSQYGSQPIEQKKDGSGPVTVGDAYKGAATDALKKCASLFGVAADVYSGEVEGTESRLDRVVARYEQLRAQAMERKLKPPSADEILEKAITQAGIELSEALKPQTFAQTADKKDGPPDVSTNVGRTQQSAPPRTPQQQPLPQRPSAPAQATKGPQPLTFIVDRTGWMNLVTWAQKEPGVMENLLDQTHRGSVTALATALVEALKATGWTQFTGGAGNQAKLDIRKYVEHKIAQEETYATSDDLAEDLTDDNQVPF